MFPFKVRRVGGHLTAGFGLEKQTMTSLKISKTGRVSSTSRDYYPLSQRPSLAQLRRQSIFRLPCFPFWSLVLSPGTCCLRATGVAPHPGTPSTNMPLTLKQKVLPSIPFSPVLNKDEDRWRRIEAEAKVSGWLDQPGQQSERLSQKWR